MRCVWNVYIQIGDEFTLKCTCIQGTLKCTCTCATHMYILMMSMYMYMYYTHVHIDDEYVHVCIPLLDIGDNILEMPELGLSTDLGWCWTQPGNLCKE